MAKRSRVRKTKKKRKTVGITRPGGKYFSCRYCGKKSKTLQGVGLEHYRTAHPHAIKKKPPRKGLTQRQIRESIKHSSPADVDIVDQVVAILSGGSDTRTFVSELLDTAFKKRRMRY